MKSASTILINILLIFVVGCGRSQKTGDDGGNSIFELMKTVSNNDVKWTRGHYGITNSLSQDAREAVRELASMSKPEVYRILYKYLDDKDRFVVAHVFFEALTGTTVSLSSTKYGDLEVDFSSDGKTSVPVGQIPVLKKKWEPYTK